MRKIVAAVVLAALLSNGAAAQTITAINPPLAYTLGDTVRVHVTMSAAIPNWEDFFLRRNGQTIHSINYGPDPVAPNYAIAFTLPEFVAPGDWYLDYNGAAYALPITFSTPTYPQTMLYQGAFKFTMGMYTNFEQYVREMVTDQAGNIYVCGNFFESLDIPPFSYIEQNDYHGFVAKFMADGTLLWAKVLESQYETHIGGLHLWQDSVLYVCGSGPMTIPNAPLVFGGADTLVEPGSNNSLGGVLLRLDADGDLQWYAVQDGWAGQANYDVVVNDAGTVFVTGMCAIYSANLPAYVYSAGYADTLVLSDPEDDIQGVYLAAYDPFGQVKWGRREATPAPYYGGIGRYLRLHQDGLLVFADSRRSIAFGGATCVNMGGSEKLMVLRTDSLGNQEWCYSLTGVLATQAAVDTAGNIYVPHGDGWGIAVLKLDAAGAVIWDKDVPHSWFAPDLNHRNTESAIVLPDNSLMVAYSEVTYDAVEHPLIKHLDQDGNKVGGLWPAFTGGSGLTTTLCWDDQHGYVLLAGMLRGGAQFGPTYLPPAGNTATVFITKVDLDFSTSLDATTAAPARALVYPDPTNGILHLDNLVDKPEGTRIMVVNILGHTVLDERMEDLSVDVSGLVPGMYVIIASGPGNRISSARFSKQ